MASPKKLFIPNFGFDPKPKKAKPVSVDKECARDFQATSAAELGLVNGRSAAESESRDDQVEKTEDVTIKHGSSQKPSGSRFDHVRDSSLFLSDRRGDRQNVEYGSLHRYSVPKYSRFGGACIVGSTPRLHLKIDTESSNYAVFERRGPSQQAQRRLLIQQRPATSSTDAIRPQNVTLAREDTEWTLDFLPVTSNVGLGGHNDMHSSDFGKNPIKLTSLWNIDPKTGSELSSDAAFDSDQISDVYIRKTQADLGRRTKLEPQNLEAWLELIDYQLQIAHSKTPIGLLGESERRSLAIVRLSIYKDALHHVEHGTANHKTLLLGMLEEGRLAWDSLTLSEHLATCHKLFPTDAQICSAYLDSHQTNCHEFVYDECKSIYVDCLQVFNDAVSRADHASRISLQISQMHILHRMTTFCREAGYEELALSIWQALIEKIFFPALDASTFEHFWESDVPRIGEVDARGWANSSETTDHRKLSKDVIAEVDSQSQPSHFSEYAQAELQQSKKLNLPAPTDNDDIVNDPFCHVMYSDLHDILSACTELDTGDALLDTFLIFCGCPPLPADGRTLKLHSIIIRDSLLSSPMAVSMPVINQINDTYFLFRSGFRALQDLTENLPEYGSSLCRFVDRLFLQLSTSTYYNISMAVYHIAFRAWFRPEEVAKLAKKLIKTRPFSLALYNAFAMAKAKLGQGTEAVQVWQTALDMSHSLQRDAAKDVILLVHSLARFHLSNDDEATASRALLHAARSSQDSCVKDIPTSADRLNAEQYFLRGWTEMVTSQNYYLAIFFAECRAWLTYIMSDHQLESAIKSYTKWTNTLLAVDEKAAAEALEEAKMRLIDMHIRRRRTYRPAFVQVEMVASATLFPENTLFMEMRSKYDFRLQLEDRIRASALADLLADSRTSIVSRAFVMAQEVQRYRDANPGCTEHSVRNMFSNTLLAPASRIRHAPLLWNMWLDFENTLLKIKTADSSPEHERDVRELRNVALAGLRYLPWHKDFAMKILQALGDTGAGYEKDCQQIHETVTERGLRLRVEKANG